MRAPHAQRAADVEPRAASHSRRINEAKNAKRNRQGDKYAAEAAAQAQGKIAAARRDHEPGEIGKQRPKQPAGALRGEIQRHAETEQAVGGADDTEVARTRIDHLRRGIEQRQPSARRHCGAKPDQFAQAGRDAGADPGYTGRCAPILVPTIATSGPPNPNTRGISRYSTSRSRPRSWARSGRRRSPATASARGW